MAGDPSCPAPYLDPLDSSLGVDMLAWLAVDEATGRRTRDTGLEVIRRLGGVALAGLGRTGVCRSRHAGQETRPSDGVDRMMRMQEMGR